MPARVFHTWRPIATLEDPTALASPDIRAFTKVWQRQRARLEELEILGVFQERLARQWSIETGVLERLYDLSRGLTVTLIEKGFHASLIAHGDATMEGERLVEILDDHREGLDMVMDLIGGARGLSVGWIKELHALFTRHQPSTDAITPTGQRITVPLLRGAFKQRPNNPLRRDGSVHEYCPPEHVLSEMDGLVAGYHALPPDLPEVRAAWLHHRFTQIHPFQDGNGRVARALASFEFIRGGLLPLLVERDDRDTLYIPALEAADRGDLQPLVTFFADCMSRVLLRASAEAELLIGGKRDFQAVLKAGRKKVEARKAQTSASLAREHDRLRMFTAALQRRFETLRIELAANFPDTQIDINVITPAEPPGRKLFHNLVSHLARRNRYGISTAAPGASVGMHLRTDRGTTMISAMIPGTSQPGVWILDVILGHESFRRPDQADVYFLNIEPLLLTDDDDETHQITRIDAWFESMKVQAVAQWIQFL